MTHIDTWLDEAGYVKDEGEQYARFWLEVFRMPAFKRYMYDKFMGRLFCTYEGKRYRVTGASRLGDIWLTEDFTRSTGYDKRVDVDKCTDWKATHD